MGNFCQKVFKSLGSYMQVFTVINHFDRDQNNTMKLRHKPRMSNKSLLDDICVPS